MKTAQLIPGETYVVASSDQFARGSYNDIVVVLDTELWAVSKSYKGNTFKKNGVAGTRGVAVAERARYRTGTDWVPAVVQPGRIAGTLADAQANRDAEKVRMAERAARANESKIVAEERNYRIAQLADNLGVRIDSYRLTTRPTVEVDTTTLLALLERLAKAEGMNALGQLLASTMPDEHDNDDCEAVR